MNNLNNRKRLGDILIEQKVITDSQLSEALSYQKVKYGKLGHILIELGFLNEDDILNVLSDQFKLKIVSTEDIKIDEKVLKLFSEKFVKDNLCIPFSIVDDKVNVLVSDPTNILIKDEIKKTLGLDSDFLITYEREIERVIDDFYLKYKVIDTFKSDEFVVDTENEEEDLLNVENNSSLVVDIVNNMLKEAIKEKSSDIHIGVINDKVCIRFRIDGVLIKHKEYPLQIYKQIVSRIKTISKLNVTDLRGFQNGRVTRTIGDQHVDMRVSTLPTIYGEKVVIRLLDKANLFSSVEKLGFNEKSEDIYNRLIKYPYGMILITGPTGSGKSSTLYTTINEIMDISKNIITLEDPVEYKLNGIEQVQVNEKAGITFSEGLRAILRQDPNIIMVGEIRDKDTAQISTRAALTGHLVFSTLHTNDAVSSVSRMVDMGVEPYLVANTVMGVVNQRLIRKLCVHCKEEYLFDGNQMDKEYFGIGNEENLYFYKAVGCKKCNDTGYSGRIALHEVLLLDDELRGMVSNRISDIEIRKKAEEKGLISLKKDGFLKAKKGITSLEEVKKNII